MPDGRACCDDVVVRRDGGGWKIEVADDWQRPMWGGSSSRGTGEPCLGETGELSLRAYRGFAAEHRTKKLSCRREAARCFVSLNISLSHSKSLKVIIKYYHSIDLIRVHSNYVPILYQDFCRKVRFFFHSRAFDASVRRRILYGKTRIMELAESEKSWEEYV